jgi:diguanylate cyclase (GGDEF)-like protein
MKHHDEVIGAIYVDARTTNRQYLSQSAELMRGLAAMAAVAVVNMRLFEESVRQARVAAQLAERERVARELADKNAELERLNAQLRASAVTDPLTGIGNRRLMVERLSAAFQASQQGSPPLSVIIADIDHFKRINDTWGHQTGDHVIQETARRIQGSLRDGDRVFRFGGEELVVLTHARDTSALDALGERLRCALADAPMQMDNTRYATVTASFGASRMRPDTDTRWEEILQRADAALYNAKARGRNQMVLDNDTDFRAHESVA